MTDTDRLSRWLHGRSLDDRLRLPEIADLPQLAWSAPIPLPADPPGWFTQAYAVHLDGTLGILRSDVDVAAIWDAVQAKRGGRRQLVLPPDTRCMLTAFDGTAETAPRIAPFRHPFPRFDRLADGGWIVADNVGRVHHAPARVATHRPDGAWDSYEDPGTPMMFGPVADGGNAMRIDPTGDASRLELGDDIIHLLADPDGGFWVSYGDTHMDAGGVVRYDAQGRRQWAMGEDREKPCVAVCDHPYAVNVGREGAWAYTYTEFLLSRLTPPQHRFAWRPGFVFADAMAVADRQLMLAAPERLHGQRHHVTLLDTADPVLPRRPRRRWIAGIDVPTDAALFTGRDDVLHLVTEQGWQRLSLAQADAQVPPGPWRM